MTYIAPAEDMEFVITELCDFEKLQSLPGNEDVSEDMIAAILEEAGKYASNVLSPLNQIGDQRGASWDAGTVATDEAWKGAYQQLVELGWNAPSASADHGGMGLPNVVNACIQEMFQGANMAFQLCPMLTQGAVEAIEAYATEELKEVCLPKLVTGEWAGTMNLTEPQAGSDLSAIRSTATPNGDNYLIKGQKIFITYGEHDLTDNIVHLVLARLPDAPAGVKGISLFLVPKFLKSDSGNFDQRNDLVCASIEHKLGIHGSPTCTMVFGEQEGAVGYLIGEPNHGLQYMFAMMNNARLSVGIQGIGVGEHATQDAQAYALDRQQSGKPIAQHADVKRMLDLMKVGTETARVLACRAAVALDLSMKSEDDAERAYFQRRLDLLIPVVKGYSTEQSIDIASLGVQVHGGMGYVEETGVAQHLRDARITTIYEGTTGIQALDLVGRKILRDEGLAVSELVEALRISEASLNDVQNPAFEQLSSMTAEAANLIAKTTSMLLEKAKSDSEASLSCATDVMYLFGICLSAWAAGDAALKSKALSDKNGSGESAKQKLQDALFFRMHVFPMAEAKFKTVSSILQNSTVQVSVEVAA